MKLSHLTIATTESDCAAIICAVACDDTEQLFWCWSVITGTLSVLCYPPPICLLHIADTQPLLYLQYSRMLWYVAAAEVGRKVSGRIATLLVASLSHNFAYLRPSRLSPSFPLYRHTSVASPASMTLSTVASFLQNCSDTTKNEVPPCRLKSRKPYNKEAQAMLSVIPHYRTQEKASREKI